MPSIGLIRHARGGEPPAPRPEARHAALWRCLPRPSRAALAALSTALFLALAPAAGADVGATIISRCTHGQSISGFSPQAYRQALQELPTEVEEYSDCGNLIRQAELAAAGGGGGGGGGFAGGPAGSLVTPIPLTPSERSALKQALKSSPSPLRVDGALVQPGVVPVDAASAVSSLPTPLLATLAFILACALLLAGTAIRNRVRAYRSR